ncbi:MAG TPA: response regulator [Candidatus Edwardsbacteria bacterium]|nr:response regulator [Candidatus Edwardsbacteria bacterium]
MATTVKPKILIADHDETAVNFFQAALGDQGYQVSVARDGKQALAATLSFPPDLVLVDAQLPDMTGFELTERLKSDPTTAAISVILLTEMGTIEDKVKGLEAGADDFLVRPFILEVLLARVRSLVKLKQLQDRLHAVARPPHGDEEHLRPAPRPGLILVIEDDDHVSHVFSTILATGGYQVAVARDAGEADRMLEQNVPNLILLDLMLPGVNGLAWMEQVKQNPVYSDVPVIIVTAVTDINAKVMGLNMGADDYLIKPVNTMELLARVNANIRKHHAEQRLRAQVDDEFQQSVFDPLTGLYNRRYLESLMVRDAALSRQKGLPLTMLVLDIDRFKSLAGPEGGEAGDLVLKAVAGMLKTELRGSDLAVRWGTDTFTVTLYGINAMQAMLIAERLRQKTQRLATPAAAPGSITVSIGVGEFAPADSDLKTVLKRAEQAMRIAKASGRNRVVEHQDGA